MINKYKSKTRRKKKSKNKNKKKSKKVFNNKRVYFSGRLIHNPNNSPDKQYIYYQDLSKKWKQFTNKKGFELLLNCFKKLQLMLKHNSYLILKNNFNYKKIISDGYKIYKNKTSLKNTSKSYGTGEYVTWTKEEYAHLGMQRYYLIVKSFQRFSETWSLLERSRSFGVFNRLPKLINFVSVGGGPGFECYTFELFIKEYYPDKKCQFFNLDLEPKWGEYTKKLGKNYQFHTWDLYKDDLYNTIGVKKVHYIMISNVLVMYMTNNFSYNLIKEYLDKGTRAIFINSRSKEIEAKYHLKKMNIKTNNLINIEDDRNIIFSNKKFTKNKKNISNENIFPNVPYVK